jgi:2TM domain
MFSKDKNIEKITLEQHELIENAQQRIGQKKRLYYHVVFFIIGNVFFIIINKIIKVRADLDWSFWVITIWAFFLVIHVINVFITHKFLGKAWERKEREKLVNRQKAKIVKLQEEVEKEFPSPQQQKDSTV